MVKLIDDTYFNTVAKKYCRYLRWHVKMQTLLSDIPILWC